MSAAQILTISYATKQHTERTDIKKSNVLRSAVARWLPSRLIPHRHRPRAELQPVHELQVDTFRESREQRRPVAGQPGMDHELVLIDQSELRQRQWERHTARGQSLTRLLLELL